MPAKKPTDRPILWLTRQPQGLVPTTPFDLEYIERYRIGTHLVCTIEQPKDERMNRRFHGLIGLIAKATGENAIGLKSRLMIKAGFFHSVDHYEGIGTGFTPRSFGDLEAPEREELFWRVVEIISADILPGIDNEELLEEIGKYTGARP